MVEPANRFPAPRRILGAPEQISSTIKEWILDGSLHPGDRLPPEHELADLFGVSRPTLRRALAELCATHVLVVQRGRTGGHRVAELSVVRLEPHLTEFISLSLAVRALSPADLLEVRIALELPIARTAALRRTAAQLVRLEETLERLLEVVQAPGLEPAAVVELDIPFHHALAECTQNQLMVSFERAMTVALHRFVKDYAEISPGRAATGLPELVRAVADQDGEAAMSAMKDHLGYFAEHFGVPSLEGGNTAAPDSPRPGRGVAEPE